SAAIRLPRYQEGRDKALRLELRFPDPSANPYLALGVMLAAALDGIDNGLPCPEPLNNVNIYHLTPEERTERGIGSLPASLGEALAELEADATLKEALGESVYAAFMAAKTAETEAFRLTVTDWEVERYLETA
ncbi:MAG: glutamine synthetase, partial [Anaerolineae bacterium]